jgi:hypothetical protein
MNGGIQSTKDYKKFTLVRGNRDIIPGHVAKLTTSILQKNMLAQNPIIVNEKFEVIDGQHRLEVAKNNDLEVFYIVLPGADFTEIIAFNANNRVWNAMDYINGYASKGMKDYLWLKEFIDNYAISTSQALTFMFGHEGSAPRAMINRGLLELTDEQKERAISRADVLWSLRPFIKRSGFIPRAFLYELLHLHEEGLGQQLIKAVKARGETFVPEANRKDAHDQLRIMLGTAQPA